MSGIIPIILMIVIFVAVRNASKKAQNAQNKNGSAAKNVPPAQRAAGYGQRVPAPPKPAAGIQPLVDPLPQPGHEECDPTEGSMEIPGRSPEGAFSDEGETVPEALLRMQISEEDVSAVPIMPVIGRAEETAPVKLRPMKPASVAQKPRFDANQLRQAVITSEILGRPMALRGGRR